MNILIVDDEEIQRTIIEYTIKKIISIKHNIYHAIDGNDAVEKVLDNDFKFIIMDITMPKCNGFEATCLIRTFNENVIIYACSAADVDSHIREKCEESGMNGFFHKPFKPQYVNTIFKLIKK